MISGGPNIETQDLILNFDTTNYKCYKGEPTTNVISNPAANGRFTSANTWGTFNTDLYNSNVAFTLTTSDITNNIVTFSYQELELNTYDVVRPQTTGGGLSSSTDYFVKKVATNQYTFHAYNGSQTGVDGYINPSTGYHKVHDSIWLDQRISVSLSGFPTSFKCIEHKANKSIVKELIINGGRIKGTNCMRIHRNRDVNSSGGMAYGVGATITNGDVVRVSYWIKASDPRGNGSTVYFRSYMGSAGLVILSAYQVSLDWQLKEHTFVATNDYQMISYFLLQSNLLHSVDVCDYQVEIGKAYSTPFTDSSRSTTNALLDLSKNDNHGTFLNGTFTGIVHYQNDSVINPLNNAYVYFDGTNDLIQTPINSFGNNTTWECWVNRTSSVNTLNMFMGRVLPYFAIRDDNRILFSNRLLTTGQVTFYSSGFSASNNTWYHLSFTTEYDGTNTTKKIYINGILNNSRTSFGAQSNADTSQFSIGDGRSTSAWYPFNGKVSMVRIYNRTLSSSEILNNYNSTKSRYL